MRVLGLITEYNPFHNGHKYHLEMSKQKTMSTHTIAVMSGHFLQRGEPAVFDKWTRTKMAINEGVDLLIELPTIYSCNSAEFFAMGSIRLLDKLNIVKSICFGSEHGDIKEINKLAEILANEPPEFCIILKKYLDLGLPFPSAREKSIEEYFHDNKQVIDIMNSPNNILGIEYLKALKKINSEMEPFTIKRIKSDYNSKIINSDICSATAIRDLFSKKDIDYTTLSSVVPKYTFEIIKEQILKNKGPLFPKDLSDILLYRLRTISKSELYEIHDIEEGLENRIIEAAIYSTNYENLIDAIKTKRYTFTRIQRVLMKSILSIYKEDIFKLKKSIGPQYIRVLGFSEKGRELLKLIKEKSDLPIITNLKNYTPQNDIAKNMINLDVKATNIYNLLYKSLQYKVAGLDYISKPYIQS